MNIAYHFLSPEEFFPFFHENRPNVFVGEFNFAIESVKTEMEKEKVRNMPKMENIHRYQLVAKDGDKIIGWSFGQQRTYDDFYMINSAIFPEYRRQGIYTELLRMAVEHIKELGFQRIFSKHKMSNNNILIPKLKFGFVITGLFVNDDFGSLIELSYYTNSRRRELLEIRTGMRRPSKEDMELVY